MKIRIADVPDMSAIYELRHKVFVLEQGVPVELERDSEDATAIHIIAEDNGIALGCARILMSEDEAHIGRLAVKRELRGNGIGAEICRFIIDRCRDMGCTRISIHSQLHAVDFYKKLGFVPYGEEFSEAGIRHIEMKCHLIE